MSLVLSSCVTMATRIPPCNNINIAAEGSEIALSRTLPNLLWKHGIHSSKQTAFHQLLRGCRKTRVPEWDRVRGLVKEALGEYGCFEATFHGVPMDLRKSLLGTTEVLFELPLETKMRNFSKKPYHGYIGQHPMVPLYKSMGIDDADIYDKVDDLRKTFWPEGHPGFSETIQSFSERLSILDQIVRRMIVESLGLEKYLEEHMNSTNYLLRFMKHNGLQTADIKLGLTSHTDKNIVTILYQNVVEGLELKTKYGDWIPFKPTPDSFNVMIGDSLHAWTNGRLYPVSENDASNVVFMTRRI